MQASPPGRRQLPYSASGLATRRDVLDSAPPDPPYQLYTAVRQLPRAIGLATYANAPGSSPSLSRKAPRASHAGEYGASQTTPQSPPGPIGRIRRGPVPTATRWSSPLP